MLLKATPPGRERATYPVALWRRSRSDQPYSGARFDASAYLRVKGSRSLSSSERSNESV